MLPLCLLACWSLAGLKRGRFTSRGSHDGAGLIGEGISKQGLTLLLLDSRQVLDLKLAPQPRKFRALFRPGIPYSLEYSNALRLLASIRDTTSRSQTVDSGHAGSAANPENQEE